MGVYGIGVTALNTAQAGLTTTGHNISNANTIGFHRQQIVQGTNIPQYLGVGFMGQGVHVDTIKRIYSEVLDNQVMQAQATSSQLDAYGAQINQIDNMLADPSAGLSPALQDFFNGVHDVAANPSSVPSRQAMINTAQTMVSRFQTIDQRFKEIRDGINSQVTSSVAEINSYARQIAEINQQITVAQSAASDQQPANDLLDQRDQLLGELNKIVKVTTVKQDNGILNVFIGNGQTLVVGSQASQLAATPALQDPERIEVGIITIGKTVLLGQGSMQGGSLGGILAFRSETLDPAQNALGRVAIGLAQTFNDQHQLGIDLNGALGGNFFTLPVPKVIPNLTNPAGAAVTATISNVGAVTTSDYLLNYNGATATWSLLNTTTNQAVTTVPAVIAAGIPFVADGLSIVATPPTVTSQSASFLIKPTINGARDITVAISDPTKIAAAAPIVTGATSTNTGSGAISAGVVNTGTPVTVNPAHPTTDLNLQQSVTITFNSPYDGMFDVTGVGVGLPANNQIYTAGANISFNGWTVQLNGSPAAGDSFTVGTNAGGVTDNRNALLLAGLQTQNTLSGSATSYQGAYSQLVSLVGNQAHEIDVTGKAQAKLVTQTEQAQQSLSGVNLDEEAANLMRYQQAYQAAGKMIQIAGSLFDTLIHLGG
ncbi:MAG: flagellar hook-associated protein FlgK [Betaproteobacteria bacterium]|nr:flagellar hook-associated protein FlgK [Betaproteobacteria bacterium]